MALRRIRRLRPDDTYEGLVAGLSKEQCCRIAILSAGYAWLSTHTRSDLRYEIETREMVSEFFNLLERVRPGRGWEEGKYFLVREHLSRGVSHVTVKAPSCTTLSVLLCNSSLWLYELEDSGRNKSWASSLRRVLDYLGESRKDPAEKLISLSEAELPEIRRRKLEVLKKREFRLLLESL